MKRGVFAKIALALFVILAALSAFIFLFNALSRKSAPTGEAIAGCSAWTSGKSGCMTSDCYKGKYSWTCPLGIYIYGPCMKTEQAQFICSNSQTCYKGSCCFAKGKYSSSSVGCCSGKSVNNICL